MKRIIVATVPLFLILALALVGCGKTPGSASTSGGGSGGGSCAPDTIGMTSNLFACNTLTVKAGQPVHLDDTVNGGGYHIICVGQNQMCDASGSGPSQFYGSGLTIQNGQKMDVTFPTAGTYNVICTVHTGMVIKVTVQ